MTGLSVDKCSECNSDIDKVIYLGLPGTFCTNRECNCLDGLAALVLTLTSQSGYFEFMIYEGSYLKALWVWLKG